jgi:WD40 repeat protein
MKSKLIYSDKRRKRKLIIVYSYHANSWLVKITSNGRYLLAPTIDGQIFVFNMRTGKASAIIKEHEGKENAF